MIARPVIRPRPIPFAEQAPGAKSTRPVNWANSSGATPMTGAKPVQQAAATTLMAALAPARRSPVRVAHDAGASPRTVATRQGATAQQPGCSSTTTGTATGEFSAKFVGRGALSVRSSVTGRHYRFQQHGECLAIDKHDLMMLKRIADLIVT